MALRTEPNQIHAIREKRREPGLILAMDSYAESCLACPRNNLIEGTKLDTLGRLGSRLVPIALCASPLRDGPPNLGVEGREHLPHRVPEYHFGSDCEFHRRAARKAFALAKHAPADAEEHCHIRLGKA